jgi:hypothetical protein
MKEIRFTVYTCPVLEFRVAYASSMEVNEICF